MLTLDEVLDDARCSGDFPGQEIIEVNSRGMSGLTPLHFMAILGDCAGGQLIISAGASLNASDDTGDTPLHKATRIGHQAFVTLLLRNGALPSVTNAAGQTAGDIALELGRIRLLEILSNAA